MANTTFTELDQDARVARAMREEFDWTTYDQRQWICATAAGGDYLVSEESCTCPDWQYRIRGEGRCKHQVALGHKLLADGALTVARGLRMTRKEEPRSAAEWLASVDIRPIVAHVEAAKMEDAADDFDAEFRRIFG